MNSEMEKRKNNLHKSDTGLNKRMQPRGINQVNETTDFSNSSFRAVNKGSYQPISSQNNIQGGNNSHGLSPYLGAHEDQFGQRGKPMAQPSIAAEIKVNRTTIIPRQGDTYGYGGGQSTGMSQPTMKSGAYRNVSNSPSKPQYDTREEDGQNLNTNQNKSYNKQHEFFTKSLGPGHYEPTNELTKPKTPGAGFGAYKGKRNGLDTKQQAGQNPPGPGEYTYQNDTIQMKQIPNLNNTEDQEDKRRG